jgi:hypothetical protein
MVPLRTQEAGEELGVGDILFLGSAQLFFINLVHAPKLEILQQLIEFLSHR